MIRPLARTHATQAAWLALATGTLALASGCSTMNQIGTRIGSAFGFGGDDPEVQDAATPELTAQAEAGDVPDQEYIDPFTPAQRDGAPVVRRIGSQPWSRSRAAGVFGEFSDAYMGPTRIGLPHTGADNLDQVSFSHVGADFDPCVSRDGSFIIFSSTQHNETANIYRKAVNGHTITQLSNEPANDVMPSISPDGSRIAFASDRSGSWNIYIMNTEGGQAVQLTDDPAHQLHPTWSPDGSRLAFCRLGDTSGRWELWVTDVQNPAVRHFIGYGLLPEWSPNSNKIVFQRARQRGDRFFSIWTIDFINGEGVNPTEIVSSPIAATVNPTFSPDGERIAFAVVPNPDEQSADNPAMADLWICNLDGTGRANLTGGQFVNLMPTWGADGRIYFISDRSGTDNIWALRPERAILAAQGPSGGQRNLATVPAEDEPNE